MVSRNYKILVGLLILLTVISVVIIIVVACIKPDKELIINLPNGKIRGRDNGYYYSFESIPFAEPPIGKLRFESPKPFEGKWTDMIYDATIPLPLCMQWPKEQGPGGERNVVGVEDCLYVSVHKPKNDSRTSFPVMVQVPGGAFMVGGGSRDSVDRIMRKGNFIVVNINYRLGPLGFLSTLDNDLPGNYGLKDQRLALQWIKQNIEYFGGEPENILLFGFSAGGVSVHFQILKPGLERFAKVAVSQSGTALSPWAITYESRQRAFKLGEYLNCETTNGTQLKTCLQTKTGDEIVSSVERFFVLDNVPHIVFGPVIEAENALNAFITQHPREIIKSKNFSQIPWLASYNKDDGAANAAMFMRRQDDGTDLIEMLNDHWYEFAPDLLLYQNSSATSEELNKHSDELKQSYLGDRPFSSETYFDFQRMFTDVLFKNGVQESVSLHRQYGSPAVYSYLYDNPADFNIGFMLSNRTDINFGTGHGDDFHVIFSNEERELHFRPDEEVISKKFITMLEGFVQSNSSELFYDNCSFVNNVGKVPLQLVNITRNACNNLEVTAFP